MHRQHYCKCVWTRRDGRRCWAPGRYDVAGVAVCEWHLRAAQAEYARMIGHGTHANVGRGEQR
jgi:hypothetical protein